MSSIIDDTMSTAKNVVGSARENAENAMGAAKAGAEHAAAKSRSVFFDRVRAVTHLIAVVRSLGGDDVLGWIGLARRRSPLYTFAAFGAGIAVGAGVGMLLAPMAGKQLRGTILAQMRLAKVPIAQVETTVHDTAKKVEKKVETKLERFADKVGNSARQYTS
jgi:hypothetical protein